MMLTGTRSTPPAPPAVGNCAASDNPPMHGPRSLTTWSWLRAGVVVALCCFGVLGWQGVTTVGLNRASDSGEHIFYTEYLYKTGSLPGEARNYEYATPILFHVTAIAVEYLSHRAPSHWLELPWNWVTRALWLALIAGGAAAMTARRARVRLAGAAGLVLAGIWGLDEAVSLDKTQEWSGGQLIALAAGTGLVLVTGLIAREVWPDRPRRSLAAAAFVAAYPVVYRMSILFHPEMPLAFLCALSYLLFLRAARLGWPRRLGWALGATCGAAALTRQTAIVVIVCLGVGAAVLGGRRALGFLARAAVLVVLIAGPWWIYAYRTWHNPLQSNLEPHTAVMLNHQPLSFYASFPIESLVVHPYRDAFANELLPKLHAELWSDWFGVVHPWLGTPSRLDRVTASTQSVLGFFGDMLAIGGLAALAVPAALRVLRRRSRSPDDVGLGLLAVVTLAAFSSFVVMLIRFPQQYGDPIKSSYLLFTAPAWAIFSIAAWAKIRKRRRGLSAVLTVVAALYIVSYAADLGAAFGHRVVFRPPPGLQGAVDLAPTWQVTSPLPDVGGPVDFLVGVNNTGNQTADDVILTVRLPAGMRVVGPPFYERGTGCSEGATIVCNLSFLAGGASTFIRFEVQVSQGGPQILTATVSSPQQADVNPADNTSSFVVNLSPPKTAKPIQPG